YDSSLVEVAAVGAVVDLAYNMVVAASLGLPNTYQESDVPAATAAFAAADTTNAFGDRLIEDVDDHRDGLRGLTWSDVEAMLPELESFATSVGRRERLRTMYQDVVIAREQAGSAGFSVRVALPGILIAGLGNLAVGAANAALAGAADIAVPVLITALV